MRLSPSLIRDILLTVEEISDGCHKIIFSYRKRINYERLKGYSNEEIIYHVRQCCMSGFLDGKLKTRARKCSIVGLSQEGRETLSSIRDDDVWDRAVKIAKEIGVVHLSMIMLVISKLSKETALDNQKKRE